jgi:ribosomal protein L7/L12
MLYVLAATLAVLALLTLSLLARVARLEKQMAQLNGRADPGPYRAPPSRSLASVVAAEAAEEDPAILEALRDGNLILAIKRHREITGAGLRESKEAIEALRDRLGLGP